MLPRIQPIAPKRIQAPFDHTEFVFELKMDGWRCLTYIEDGTCRLISRKLNQFKSFGPLTAALAKLPVQNAIIDGEVVCLDGEGKSVFLDLMRKRRQDASLYCFDLLWLNGFDLRPLPLLDRKHKLQRLLKGRLGLLYAEHVLGKGTALFQAICAKDLEGVVTKHKFAPYSPTPQSWFKVLNPDYTQKRGRKEMFEKFYERERASVT
jgi:bifunctional non-homologous end joining protein LigD